MLPCYSGWESMSPIIPKLYYDVDSVEQRTKALSLAVEKMEQYSDLVAAELNRQDTEIKALKTEDVRLLNLIQCHYQEIKVELDRLQKILDGMGEGGELMYDYVTASYEDSKNAVRTIRNDTNTVNGLTVAETACYTVAQMANSKLTARGWALVSRNVMKPHQAPRDMFVSKCNCNC